MVFLIIIFLAFLILIHGLGHFLMAKLFGVRVEEFGFGFPPRLLAKKFGKTVYSFNILPFGGFVRIFGLEKEPEKLGDKLNPPKDSFLAQPVWRRSLILLAGISMNVFLGWLLFSFIFMLGNPYRLLISEVFLNSPAKIADLKPGDAVLKINRGEQTLQAPLTAEEFSKFIQEDPGGIFDLTIKRQEKVLNFQIQGRSKPPAGQGPMGIALADVGSAKQPFFQAFLKGGAMTFSVLKEVAVGLFKFFSQVFVNSEILKSVAGPVGIFSLAFQFGSFGLFYFLQFIAILSLNLAVLNILPFPALDGGQIIFFLIEKIKGSPVSFRVQKLINGFGFAVLIFLVILITIQDIGRLL